MWKETGHFSGSNTSNDFHKWLISERNKDVTAIPYNARTYNAYSIYDHWMKNSIIPEPNIFSGSKLILFIKVETGLNN